MPAVPFRIVHAFVCATLLCLFILPRQGVAQGILLTEDQHRLPWPIPRPEPRPLPEPALTYAIESLKLDLKIKDQIAHCQISQVFHNTGSSQIETSFVFPLAASPSDLTFLVDGKEYSGELMDKDKARKIYDDYVRRNRDPALLEWVGHGLYKTSVFPIPAGAKRTVTLKYDLLIKQLTPIRDEQAFEMMLPLKGAKFSSHPLKEFAINVDIQTTQPIGNIYVNGYQVEEKQINAHHSTVSYKAENTIPSTDFRMLYDVSDKLLLTQGISYKNKADVDGYFLLLARPKFDVQPEQITRKSIVFVIDRSGSMSGKKIEQAKSALSFCLSHLNKDDLFNIIAYDTQIEQFKPELQKFNSENLGLALAFVERITDGGSTNINDALTEAVKMFQNHEMPSYVVFLTDGLPTAGEQNEMKIARNVQIANEHRARIFSFGVGYDVNSRLLDRLSNDNNGLSEYVLPDGDLEGAVSRFYAGIASPVVTGVKLAFRGLDDPNSDPVVTRVYPQTPFDIFSGQQVVLAGRYKKEMKGEVVITGQLAGQEKTFTFPIRFVSHEESASENRFIGQLWATRRVASLIDQIDLNGKNQELIDELVKLATEFGIITPYTSFLAQDDVKLSEVVENRKLATVQLESLQDAEGASGVQQRAEKQRMYKADASPAAAASGNVTYFSLTENKQVELAGCKQIGGQTFFQKQGVWMESKLTEEQLKNAIKITPFSEAYFQLADTNDEVRSFLALGEKVSFETGGKTYIIEAVSAQSK